MLTFPPISALPGVYIHWPFCARKCPYCDFYTFGREHPHFERSRRYLPVLIEEIRSAGRRFEIEGRPKIDSVYLGGGTPSLLEPEELRSILGAVAEMFELDPDSEVTLEVNPTAAEAERLGPAREAGVNRLSIGCQSFDDKYLEILGRDHDAATARRVVRLARDLGFENISLDLMFALPGQTIEELANDLDAVLAFDPEHVSLYGLTLHQGTPMKRWAEAGRIETAPSERQADMFEMLMGRLATASYAHYEISNWAKSGLEARHNSKYWRQCDIFAFGASAHGVYRNRRYSNARDLTGYMSEADGASAFDYEDEAESAEVASAEIMMLALRRVGGVRWGELDVWLGRDARALFGDRFARLQREGLIEANEQGLGLKRKGILVADSVIESFL